MEITISQEQGRVPVTILHVKGDVNSVTADAFLAQAQQAYDDGARDLLVDLSQVALLSSAGLRALHRMFDMLRGQSPGESDEAIRRGLTDGTFKSPHLKLLKPSKNVSQVLRMAGFDMFLETHDDLKKAVESF